MINSGKKFYLRYENLTKDETPFFRASSAARVVESAENFAQGFHAAKQADPAASKPSDSYPYHIIQVLEAEYGSNNTLNHDLCTAFENGTDSTIADIVEEMWLDIFISPIRKRLNDDLPGANLSSTQSLYMMDLCPFNTVASNTGAISPFCSLFTADDWHQYAYYESLDKHYGYGAGNPLGPTQGVGFANELIARMTGRPVQDYTTVNHTLDDNPATFPLGREHNLFADFSHDNDMTAVFFALGLYNMTKPLSNTRLETTEQTSGYSAAWTVPFAARAYFEKMQCAGERGELVRVLINDRVVPLQSCGADQFGRCKLSKWVESLSFVREGGLWNQCFV